MWPLLKKLLDILRSFLNFPKIMLEISVLKHQSREIKRYLRDTKKDLTILKRLLIAEEIQNKNYLNTYNFNGKIFQFYDNALSFNPDITIENIIPINEENQVEHPYFIKNIDFKPGDIILDIGANIGIFSIYLAKEYPELKILAFEPVKQTFENLKKNIEISDVKNIIPYNCAVTGDGREVEICYLKDLPGSSVLLDYTLLPHAISRLHKTQNISKEKISSVTLDDIFHENNIKTCKLLKIDVEGSEDEILRASKRLDQVEFIIGELHYGNEGNSNLKKYLEEYFLKGNMRFEEIG